MSCENFNNCDCCTENEICQHDYKGDHHPFCWDFVCNVDECKRGFCLSPDEELSDV